MARGKFFKLPCLTVGQQVGLMETSFAQFQRQWSRNFVSWTGDVRPSEMSEIYRIRIDYTFRCRPKVWVLSPALTKLPDGEKIKHRFSDNSLSAYLGGLESRITHHAAGPLGLSLALSL